MKEMIAEITGITDLPHFSLTAATAAPGNNKIIKEKTGGHSCPPEIRIVNHFSNFLGLYAKGIGANPMPFTLIFLVRLCKKKRVENKHTSKLLHVSEFRCLSFFTDFLYVKQEVHYVAVLHHILLPLGANQPFLFCRG